MGRPNGSGPGRHSGRSERGVAEFVRVDRIGKVSIYKRGSLYYLYFREQGDTKRPKVNGNLQVARATAAAVNQMLAAGQRSPYDYEAVPVQKLVTTYLVYVRDVQKLAIRTHERYRAALELFVRFCDERQLHAVDRIDPQTVDQFIAWARLQKRGRNGAKSAKQQNYSRTGIEYVLSICRTAFNWGRTRKYLPPHVENPFGTSGKAVLKGDTQDENHVLVFTPEQQQLFFSKLNDWQEPVYRLLAAYGLRIGELLHLLVEDVDFERGVVHIRSKPEFFWSVKTRQCRQLPLTPATEGWLKQLIGGRTCGFVVRGPAFVHGRQRPPKELRSPKEFAEHFRSALAVFDAEHPEAGDKLRRDFIRREARKFGWVTENRVRNDFMKVTACLGMPEFTRVHQFRHLFITRAQEDGANPLLVADIVGQNSLTTTRKYTHLGQDTKRQTIAQLLDGRAADRLEPAIAEKSSEPRADATWNDVDPTWALLRSWE